LVDGLGQRIQGGTVWWTVEVLSGIDESFARCLDKVEGHMVCDFALDVEKMSTAAGARIEAKRSLGWTIPTENVPRFGESKAARHDSVLEERRNADLRHSLTCHGCVESSDLVMAGISVRRKLHLSECLPWMPRPGTAVVRIRDDRHRYSFLPVVIVFVPEYSVKCSLAPASFPYPRVVVDVSQRSTWTGRASDGSLCLCTRRSPTAVGNAAASSVPWRRRVSTRPLQSVIIAADTADNPGWTSDGALR